MQFPKLNILFRYENILFFIVTLLMLTPIFAHTVFLTHDGSAHVYNSQIIKAFISNETTFYDDFFKLNPFAEPNWTGHILLTTLLFFLKPFDAEKVLVAMYVLSFCYSFRYWVKSVDSPSPWLCFLIFPFVYNTTLYIGFYNFCLGLSCVFLSTGYWLRHAQNANWKHGILLFLLFVLGYFTHITTFIISVIFVGSYMLFSIVEDVWKNKQTLLHAVLKFKVALLSLFPVLLFSITFFLKHGGSANHQSYSFYWLCESLLNTIPAVAYHDDESTHSRLIGLIIFGLSAVALFDQFFSIPKNEKGNYQILFKGIIPFFHQKNITLFLAVFFLVLYFVLPNEMSSGGFVSLRLLLVFFLLLVVWLASQNIHAKLVIPLLVVVTLCTSHLFAYRNTYAIKNTLFVKGLLQVSADIPDGSVVLPYIRSEHWLYKHSSNYLGVVKPVIVLDNYEAETHYFPILWKTISPYHFIGENVHALCGENVVQVEEIYPLDYILSYNDQQHDIQNNCTIPMQQFLQKHYEESAKSDDGRWLLFRKK